MRHVRSLPAASLLMAIAVLSTACAPSTTTDATPSAPGTAAPAGAPGSSPSSPQPVASIPGAATHGTTPETDAPAPADATPPPPGSLPEPSTPAAESSPQAAATATETYFALLQANKPDQADRLWREPAQAAAFRAQYESLGRPQVEVDAPGGMEGAAGSSYVTVPVRFIPPPTATNPRPRHGEVVLRRVNDVPGSTAEQRRWHIDRIDVAMTPK